MPGYAAAKGGVAQLTKALANEWAKQGINVNAIAPGYMRTDNTAALQRDETRNRQILERIPAGRWGEPSDLAGAAVFSLLISERLRAWSRAGRGWWLDGQISRKAKVKKVKGHKETWLAQADDDWDYSVL